MADAESERRFFGWTPGQKGKSTRLGLRAIRASFPTFDRTIPMRFGGNGNHVRHRSRSLALPAWAEFAQIPRCLRSQSIEFSRCMN